MPITVALLLTTSLLAPVSQSATPIDTPTAPAQGSQTQEGPASTPTTSSTDRPHQVGLGGFGGSGGGPSFRYFINDRIGVDTNVGWSRPTYQSGGSAFRASSSMVVMLTKSRQMADLDVRPYVGGGLNYAREGAPIQTATTQPLQTGGMGMQAFGGAEFSFAAVPSMAISAEVAYYNLAIAPINLVTTGGTNFYVMFHYYMR